MVTENQISSTQPVLPPNSGTSCGQTQQSDLPEKVGIKAFGQILSLYAPKSEFLRSDTIWRIGKIYEPALAVNPLPIRGVGLDIGAGFGGFCIPFAMAYPDWIIWCFEPNPDCFAALKKNIHYFQIENILAVNCAVGGTLESPQSKKIAEALENQDLGRVQKLCPIRNYRADMEKPGFIDSRDTINKAFQTVSFPSLPSNLLATIGPDMVKLTAPNSEAEILEGLGDVPVGCIIGEIWSSVSSELVYSKSGKTSAWLPVAGTFGLALCKNAESNGRRPGLDVVVAMYNARDWIVECVESLISRGSSVINVLVIDDGSTDGGGDLVNDHFAKLPNVILHRKLNGGCASARNYGRIMSSASHIAFVNADDVADPDLFADLLELARYTGAEIVQGGYDMMYQEENGYDYYALSPEDTDPKIAALKTISFNKTEMITVPASMLMVGLPSIRRCIYRRDFLDSKNVWFPEHIRAFGDQVFQILSLQYAGNVPMLKNRKLHYRQHFGQHKKQGDERGFYFLEIFRLMARRALQEGWNDFTPLIRAYINTVNRIHNGLREDLMPTFLKASAELWVYMQKSFGLSHFNQFSEDMFQPSGFANQVHILQQKLADLDASMGFAWLDSIHMHAPLVKSAQAELHRLSADHTGS